MLIDSMNETSSLEMLHALIRQARPQLATLGNTVGIVLAPTLVVFDAMQSSRTLTGNPSLDGEQYACILLEGTIVLGLNHPPGHPQKDFVSVWSDEQFIPPGHDQEDSDDHPYQCPVGTPRPDIKSHPLEHAMWGIQMDDWLLHISPTITAMLQTEPVISAKIVMNITP